MKFVFILVALVLLGGCSPAFSSSASGSGGEAGAVSTSTTSNGSGGSMNTGGGGAGGSVVTNSGGAGGEPFERIVLGWNFVNHPPNTRLGIAGLVDFPDPRPDIASNASGVLLPSCLAAMSTDPHVGCDVGPALLGTVLYIDLYDYNASGGFIYYECDDPNAVGPAAAKCQGEFSVMVGGVLYAACAGPDPLISPCAAEVNAETGRRRYVISL